MKSYVSAHVKFQKSYTIKYEVIANRNYSVVRKRFFFRLASPSLLPRNWMRFRINSAAPTKSQLLGRIPPKDGFGFAMQIEREKGVFVSELSRDLELPPPHQQSRSCKESGIRIPKKNGFGSAVQIERE